MLNTNRSGVASVECLTELVYELLDAHGDTTQLAGKLIDSPEWAAHIDYLQALQRIARQTLAQVSPPLL